MSATTSLQGGWTTRIEANRHVVRVVASAFEGEAPRKAYRLSPDYERSLAEVAISVPYSAINQLQPLRRILPALKALPRYSRIHVVLPPGAERRVRKELADARLLHRATLHPLEEWNSPKQLVSKYSRSSRWIRDTFLVGTDAGRKAVAFVPLAYAQVSDLADSDLDFVHERWFDPRRVLRFPAFLRGGNLAVADSGHGVRTAFMGDRELPVNRDLFVHSTASDVPDAMLLGIVKEMAGVEKVNILPNTNHLFHIDMSITFLAPGAVAVVDPIDEDALDVEDRSALRRIRQDLRLAGFRVINVPTTAERVKAFQSPANVVPFINRRSGRSEIIVSRFPDRRVTIDGKLVSLNDAIQKAYQAEGLRVIWAEDRLSDRQGNIHCGLLGLN